MYRVSVCKPEDVCKLDGVSCERKMEPLITTKYIQVSVDNKCTTYGEGQYVERLTITLPAITLPKGDVRCRMPYMTFVE